MAAACWACSQFRAVLVESIAFDNRTLSGLTSLCARLLCGCEFGPLLCHLLVSGRLLSLGCLKCFLSRLHLGLRGGKRLVCCGRHRSGLLSGRLTLDEGLTLLGQGGVGLLQCLILRRHGGFGLFPCGFGLRCHLLRGGLSGSGIVPGKHKVLVQAFQGEMEPSTAIPAIYADPATTPLEIDTSDTKPLKLLIARP